MAKTKSTPRIRSPDELLAERTQGNPCSAPSSSKLRAEVAFTSTSSTSRAFDSGKSVLKRKGRSPITLVAEIIAEGPEFPGAPRCSDPSLGSHFSNPKVVPILKRTALEKQYLLPAGYTFVIPEEDATVNEPPVKCIAVYYAALNYGLQFPLHLMIEQILNKYESASTQSRAYRPERSQRDRGLRVILFQQQAGIHDGHREEVKGWGNVSDWNEGKLVRNLFGKPTSEERKMAHYFQFYIRDDDKPWLIPKFIARAIESMKGLRGGKATRPRLTVFETRDATPEQVAADAGLCREEERQRLVNQQAKKGRPDETVASAPTHAWEVGAGWSAPQQYESRSTGDRIPGLQEQAAPLRPLELLLKLSPVLLRAPQRPSTNFIKADPAAKFSLFQDFDLATSGTFDSPKITEEEVTMAEAFAQGVRAAAECRMVEGLTTRYQQCWEKLKADQDTREAENKDLER
ncbi:hypothetical protein Cgig2_017137 [Carnegiea gigantea]|uniref:Uncharacterized protein n=1 Tax=Carnegiea gigantea TaxID=171969 RepID=A0A9Q1Q475_9CARY|nr:hypothetical protein Cgig2_017137 [Carnegiea gigantea]